MLSWLAKLRRAKADKSRLPGQLRTKYAASDLVPADHILAQLPCTRYWGNERKAHIEGLPPPGIPGWIGRFEWVVGFAHGWADISRYPTSVFCNPDYLDKLADFLNRSQLQRVHDRSILVVGGDDGLLSGQNETTMRSLRQHFDDIYYEAKDCDHPFVKIMPIGLQEFYLRGHEKDFREAIHAPVNKTQLVAAAWGKWWPQLDRRLADRAAAKAFCEQAPFVDSGVFEPSAYYEKLSRSHFMICPLGNGVQAPKMIEALLMSSLPIMTSSTASRELRAIGIPIMIVDDWQDLSEGMLLDERNRFQNQLSEFRKIIMNQDRWWDFCFR